MPSLQRAEDLPITETGETDEAAFNSSFNGMLARNPGNLAVTSSLHPFWHTKKGKAILGLVVLTVIGAIVGGAIGGVKAHADMMKRELIVSNPTPSSACSPSVAGVVFSTTTHPSEQPQPGKTTL